MTTRTHLQPIELFTVADNLDENNVSAEVVDDGKHICIYSRRMDITTKDARQLRDWLNKVIPEDRERTG